MHIAQHGRRHVSAGASSQPSKGGSKGRCITENRDGHGMAALASYIAAKVKGIGALRERKEKIQQQSTPHKVQQASDVLHRHITILILLTTAWRPSSQLGHLAA